jgi:hypothetical protein
MKTPRNILLRRHQAAEAKLDSIRQNVVAGECRAQVQSMRASIEPIPLRAVIKLWKELIVPARRVWAGFAFLWLTLAIFNAAQPDAYAPREPQTVSASPEVLMFWRERQKLLADLNGLTESREADKPKPFTPKPRSAREDRWLVV